MSPSPLSLTARDFDAYLPEKATSKAFSRPRLELKQRALAWARGVVARLEALGIRVDVHGSDEHPSIRNHFRVEQQWVFFWRDQAARDELDRLLDRERSISQAIDDPSPYGRHAFLALRLDARAVEVCFAVHPQAKVDIDNLRARIDAPVDDPNRTELAAELTAAIRALPEQFLIGVGDDRVPCGDVTNDAIVDMLRRAAAGQEPLWVGWTVPRDVAIDHADLLDVQLEDALVALAPVYRFVAWSRDNDRIGLDVRIEAARAEQARTHAEVQAQTEKWLAEREAARERSLEEARARKQEEAAMRSAHAQKPSLATLFRSLDADRRGPPPPACAEHGPRPSPARPAPSASPAREPPSPAAREPGPSIRSAAPPGAIELGARVRVLAGAFADKEGVVSELDGRGGARVHLGLLSTRVELSDLALALPRERGEARERPAAPCAAARPTPPASRKAR